MEDARRAAQALVSNDGVAEVLLYGSVARGEQRPGSDIDLVAIFDDLDYAERPALARRAAETAERVARRRCEVYVTDYPEWEIRSRLVTHSFEHRIASDTLSLAEIKRHQPIDWGKEIDLPANNIDEAYERLLGSNTAMNALRRAYYHDTNEYVSSVSKTDGGSERRIVSNAKHCCASAAMVIETAVKSLIVIVNEEQAPFDHYIHTLLKELDGMPVVERIKELAADVSIDVAAIGHWRKAEHYPETLQRLGWDSREVIRQADCLSKLACDVLEVCTDTLRNHPRIDITDPRWTDHERWVQQDCEFVRRYRSTNLYASQYREAMEASQRDSGTWR